MKRRAGRWLWVVLAAAIGVGMVGSALAAENYLGVAPPPVHGTPSVVTTCAACHGADGVAIAPTFPNLAGQNYNYLLKSLEDFRSGKWKAAPMDQLVKVIPTAAGDANIEQVAAYFSRLPLKPSGAAKRKPTKAVAEAGYKLYFEGNPDAQVPACAACHIANGMGDAPMAVPRLAGQNAAYVVSQLQAFAKGQRPSHDDVMTKIAGRLSEKDMQAVGAYVQAMHPDLLPGSVPMNFGAYEKALKGQPVPGIPASAIAKPGQR
ncbi:MAG: c-type cytochrome [Rhodanobacteraceae bacterium]